MGMLLLFGGTFNPVHKGHTKALRAVCGEIPPEKIIIMPAKIPPHKEAPGLASGKDRLEMCRLAFSEFENAEISDFELKRQDKSYSYYTVKHLSESYPDYRIMFVVGSDMLLSFDKWHRFEDILGMCGLVCVSRENGDASRLEEKAESLRKYGEIQIVKSEPFEISSTEIRRMLKNNLDTSCYLDEIVVKYIMENNIYK